MNIRTVPSIAPALAFAVLLAAGAPGARACDTWVAISDATAPGITILAKNSDRPLFDCQPLVHHPRRAWPAGATIDLGRLTIPQVRETYATIGSSPYWCWGYEEGMNEHGVAIGNEGVFTKPLAAAVGAARRGEGPAPGPTGMDLVRLALERGRTAREALDVIARILEAHGQFGSGTPTAGVEGAYDNSFLIADAREAWILETAGARWAARRIARGTASISNALTIGAKWDRASRDLVEYAVRSGWWPKERARALDFAGAYSDDSPDGTARRERAMTRAACSAGLLAERAGAIDPPYMMRVARDRSTSPSIDLDITASSCVAVIGKGRNAVHVFWWCPAVPSSGCYVPFFVEAGGLPETVSRAGAHGSLVVDPATAARDTFSEDSYWWVFRDLCDAVNVSRDERQPVARAAFDSLEAAFASELPGVVAEAARLRRAGARAKAAETLGGFSARCVERALGKARELRARFAAAEPAAPAAASARFAPYTGVYTADFGSFAGTEFKVLERGGRLAVDIPGQMTVELNEPNAEGVRTLVLTDRVAFSFVEDAAGAATAMKLHQATILTRAPEDSIAFSDSVDARHRPYVGAYVLPIAGFAILLRESEGRLVLDTPDEAGIPVDDPDEQGRWRFTEDPVTYVTFDRNAAGAVSGVRIHQTFTLPRK